MAKRILVPLDRSHEAESVLAVVADAARGGQAVVRLLHVAPKPQSWIDGEGRILAYADQEMERMEAEGLDYLHTIELQFAEVPIDSTVRFGDPVIQILAEAESFEADLIAVSTIGRGCLKRAVVGSVADQVFRKAKTTVMLIKPGLPW